MTSLARLGNNLLVLWNRHMLIKHVYCCSCNVAAQMRLRSPQLFALYCTPVFMSTCEQGAQSALPLLSHRSSWHKLHRQASLNFIAAPGHLSALSCFAVAVEDAFKGRAHLDSLQLLRDTNPAAFSSADAAAAEEAYRCAARHVHATLHAIGDATAGAVQGSLEAQEQRFWAALHELERSRHMFMPFARRVQPARASFLHH